MYFIVGRIKAVQLDYTEAHKNLVQALRKAPQHTAIGFKQTVRCFIVMGDKQYSTLLFKLIQPGVHSKVLKSARYE